MYAQDGIDGKESARNAGTNIQSLSQEDRLEKGMATRQRILAWKIPLSGESGRLAKVGQD